MADFNPSDQNVTFFYNDGTPFNVSTSDIDYLIQSGVQASISYGSQIGASVVVLVILLLLTKAEKRRSALFALNTSALVLNIIRIFCEALYFTSDFFRVYPFFTGDFSGVPVSAYAAQILAVVLGFLLVVCIQVSLVLQTTVVCTNLSDTYRRIVLGVSVGVALVPVGFRLGMAVENAKAIAARASFGAFLWLQKANTVLLTISICFFCAVFVLKLGYTIWKRKQLGIAQFGPVQAIFIMGCQTMIVPAIFAILQFITSVHQINSNILTLVVISLPLSSLWAAAVLHSRQSPSSDRAGSRPKPWEILVSDSAASASIESAARPFPMASKILSSSSEAAPADNVDLLYPDLESGSAIAVQRDFSVESSARIAPMRQDTWKEV